MLFLGVLIKLNLHANAQFKAATHGTQNSIDDIIEDMRMFTVHNLRSTYGEKFSAEDLHEAFMLLGSNIGFPMIDHDTSSIKSDGSDAPSAEELTASARLEFDEEKAALEQELRSLRKQKERDLVPISGTPGAFHCSEGSSGGLGLDEVRLSGPTDALHRSMDAEEFHQDAHTSNNSSPSAGPKHPVATSGPSSPHTPSVVASAAEATAMVQAVAQSDCIHTTQIFDCVSLNIGANPQLLVCYSAV